VNGECPLRWGIGPIQDHLFFHRKKYQHLLFLLDQHITVGKIVRQDKRRNYEIVYLLDYAKPKFVDSSLQIPRLSARVSQYGIE
jgi:hypothetical protein